MAEIELKIIEEFPQGLEAVEPAKIRKVFPSPTLIHIKGKDPKPLFICTLLHGNELTSLFVLKKLAQSFRSNTPPRSMIIFVGNVWACEAGQRYLAHQKDYNRVWMGGDSPEHRLAEKVKEFAKSNGPLFASIDIHNNTGLNPMYGCINIIDERYKYLASLFSRTIVFFKNPSTALSIAFAEICPSVTVECGQSMDPYGIEKAFRFVMDVLHHKTLDETLDNQSVEFYHTMVQLKLSHEANYSFSPEESRLVFSENFEHLNFTPLEPGFIFAKASDNQVKMSLLDDDGIDRFEDYFTIENNELVVKKRVIPSMLTTNRSVIAKDCLGYLMEEII